MGKEKKEKKKEKKAKKQAKQKNQAAQEDFEKDMLRALDASKFEEKATVAQEESMEKATQLMGEKASIAEQLRRKERELRDASEEIQRLHNAKSKTGKSEDNLRWEAEAEIQARFQQENLIRLKLESVNKALKERLDQAGEEIDRLGSAGVSAAENAAEEWKDYSEQMGEASFQAQSRLQDAEAEIARLWT